MAEELVQLSLKLFPVFSRTFFAAHFPSRAENFHRLFLNGFNQNLLTAIVLIFIKRRI